MWRRARTASWRHAASDRPTAEATSGKPNPNTSRSTSIEIRVTTAERKALAEVGCVWEAA
jgi:hypothetical protein